MMGEVIDKVSGVVIILGKKVVGRLRENVEIGQIRVNRLQRDFESEGYFVIVNSNVNKGVDLLVFNKVSGRLVEAAESTNYAREDEFINDSRLCRYIESLNFFDGLPNVRKRLYVSYLSNVYNKHVKEKTLQWLRESRIEIIVLGSQD